MKKLLISLFMLCCITSSYSQKLDEGLGKLSEQISSGMTESNKRKIAVIEFSDLDGKITEFGKYLSEELITRLFITKKFQVVERQLLNKVLDEHELKFTGLIDENTAKELGRILGVDAICSGTITDLVTLVKVNARLVDTETGSIFSVAATAIQKDEVVKKLMGMVSSIPQKPLISQTGSSVNITGNLIINGDFKQPLSVGWKKEIEWDRSDPSKAGTNYAEIKGGELHIHHDGVSRIMVYQDVDVISTNLIFRAKANLLGGGDWSTNTRSRIIVQYKDGDKYLGQNDFEISTYREAYAGNPTARNLFFMSGRDRKSGVSSGMTEFFVDIDEEITTYLIGIAKEKVNRIRILLECKGDKPRYFSGSIAEMWIKNIELKYK